MSQHRLWRRAVRYGPTYFVGEGDRLHQGERGTVRNVGETSQSMVNSRSSAQHVRPTYQNNIQNSNGGGERTGLESKSNDAGNDLKYQASVILYTHDGSLRSPFRS